ncbi:tellurite resistance TerB family protein [Aureimonas fodinaquatilis]|uniref:Tellurite resistance TerB family protein n=1 Tax=Aureimonas fodinaquatilis TaxID=2565783 RepID=A0A5B0DUP2_9HYPH|nr:tellurite resistance TerB family protein [Aureimonas fodinaquatilis]KAA0969722.1 tellurite resistance TerB family protein [Aureimonas fodinaquatilis]
MINAEKLLDQFLGTGRQGNRPGQQPGQPGQPGQSGQTGGLPGNIGDILGSVLGGGRGGSGGVGNNALAGMLAGGLASYILRGKGGKKLGGSAVRMGGLALIAGLGYKAWQNYQARQNAGSGGQILPPAEIPDASGTPFQPAPGHEQDHARLLLSAMIAAAKADGSIDAAEEEAIFGKIDALNLDAEEKATVMDELRRPLPVEDIAAQVGTPEMGVEIYLASLLAIEGDNAAEQAYLARLAQALNLPAELVDEIHRTRRDVVE